MRVLIVDDEEIAVEALRFALMRTGHDVDVARDGHEAICLFKLHHHRLIISDWMMPEMNGIELCRQVRRLDAQGYAYFILLTSNTGTTNIVEGFAAGADDFLTKPFDPHELRARLRAAERVLSLETRDLALVAMAKLAESRDDMIGQHLERVRRYSCILARELSQRTRFVHDIDQNFIHLLHMTSPLHDIGKIGIPDRILLKPDKLTSDEMEVMKTHTTIGAQTLNSVIRSFPDAQFLVMARDIVLSHHEWFDGSGYPEGRAASKIPLPARIVALADVYDALRSPRPYKPGIGHEAVVAMICRESETHFDPEIVEAFVSSESEFAEVALSCGETSPHDISLTAAAL